MSFAGSVDPAPKLPMGDERSARSASSVKTSHAIQIARFVAILLVLLNHVTFTPKQLTTFNLTPSWQFGLWLDVSTNVLGRIGTPLLSALSGYLLVQGLIAYDLAAYVSKLKSRARTILIPYLFWSGFGLLLFWLVSLATHKTFEALDSPVSVLRAWLVEPVVYPLWFMRDLFVHVILSPLYWLALRSTKGWIITVLVAFVLAFPSYGGGTFRLDNLAAYWAGMWLAMSRLSWLERKRHLMLPLALIVTIAVAAAFTVSWQDGWRDNSSQALLLLLKYSVAVSIWLTLLSLAAERQTSLAFLGAFAFPIFLMHEPLVTIMKHIFVKMAGVPHQLAYWLILALAITVPMLVYTCARRYLPRASKLLFGGR